MSYTLVANSIPDSTTNASFRAWGTFVRDAIANCGFSQVGTGNIDWTTVAAPATPTTAQGFEVYQFNDTLQATNPVYFKLEYGSFGAGNRPAFWLTFGRGHNGTGTITANGGSLTARVQLGRNASALTNSLSYISGQSNGAAGYLVLALWSNRVNTTANLGPSGPKDTATNQGVIISIERTKDATGADTSAGVLLLYNTSSTVYATQFIGNTANGNVSTTIGVLAPGAAPLGGPVYGNRIGQKWGFYPIFFDQKGALLNPGKNLLVSYDPGPGDPASDHGGEMWTPTLYGAQHTFVYHGSGAFSSLSSPARASNANTCLLTRFD
jgi:hypothetical protein